MEISEFLGQLLVDDDDDDKISIESALLGITNMTLSYDKFTYMINITPLECYCVNIQGQPSNFIFFTNSDKNVVTK